MLLPGIIWLYSFEEDVLYVVLLFLRGGGYWLLGVIIFRFLLCSNDNPCPSSDAESELSSEPDDLDENPPIEDDGSYPCPSCPVGMSQEARILTQVKSTTNHVECSIGITTLIVLFCTPS